jgi:anti-sigma factor RsiW
MSCEAVRALLHAHVDGELDLVHELEVERHLASCPACAAACGDLQALQTALRTSLPRFEPPPALQSRIRVALRTAGDGKAAGSWWRGPALLLAVAGAVAGAWAFTRPTPIPPAQVAVVPDVVASHVRALQGEHLVSVESDKPGVVRPWFQGKLTFAPYVPDLAGKGFELVGGRLDYLHGHPAAALVYRQGPHVLHLLVWPTPGTPPIGVQSSSSDGYQLARWVHGGMEYWAVSDLEASDLARFAGVAQDVVVQHCHP